MGRLALPARALSGKQPEPPASLRSALPPGFSFTPRRVITTDELFTRDVRRAARWLPPYSVGHWPEPLSVPVITSVGLSG